MSKTLHWAFTYVTVKYTGSISGDPGLIEDGERMTSSAADINTASDGVCPPWNEAALIS